MRWTAVSGLTRARAAPRRRLAAPWALVSFAQMIDSAWLVALDRAQKAGQMLAHLLMAAGAGDRPVTLLAHSMGARLAFHCLLELCRCNALGARRAPPPSRARQRRGPHPFVLCVISPRPVHGEL